MIIEQNDCVQCDLPCTDCGRKHAQHRVCDACGAEEQLYRGIYGEYCISCIEQMSQCFDVCTACGYKGRVFYHEINGNGTFHCHDCLPDFLEKVK